MSKAEHDCCRVEINISSRGDVNIYNCAGSCDRPHRDEGHDPRPTSPGACVPVTMGAKPKQSQRRKLDKLLAENRVPSALAASFVQLSRRYLAGRTAANQLEADAFERFRGLSPSLRSLLRCTAGQVDTLSQKERDRLLDPAVLGDLDTPVAPDTLLAAFANELLQRAAGVAFDDTTCAASERPGQVRVFDPGTEEVFTSQVKICRINGLRTGQFLPALAPSDYLLEELERHCVPTIVNGEAQVDCTVLTSDCPGRAASDGTCLRVQDVEAGQSVLLEGVNYFSVDAQVRLTARPPGTDSRIVDAHVCGDIDTPVTEVIDGDTVLIADCRVHDRLTFQVPSDLQPGLYDFDVMVPNITGIPNLGAFIASNTETIRVLPQCSALFEITSQRLHAHAETAPTWAGSDEVGIRIITTGVNPNGTLRPLGHRSFRFGDVDSDESRDMTRVLLANTQPLAGAVIAIMGYEIDGEDAYENQIEGFTTLYLDLLEEQWPYFLAGLEPAIPALWLGGPVAALIALLVAAIAIAITLIVDIFIALWAPADLIIEDMIGISACDLAALTSGTFPTPPIAQYTSPGGIKVKVVPLTKGESDYTERREYRSDDEDSRYSITLRYSRA